MKSWRHKLVVAGVGSCCALVSCVEERVLNYKPFLSGVEGAKTDTPAVTNGSGRVAIGKAGENDEFKLVRENPDGTVTLISKSGRQLMAHIQRTLAEGEKNQFADQVLCEATRAEYMARGLDPIEGFNTLKKDEKEISKLFNRMPMGEHSPNVVMEPLERNMYRVRVTGQSKKGLERWTGFDMVFERGNWRLRWMVK